MAKIVKHTYQLKRGTAQRWIEINPTLGPGEPGFETDTGQLKIGDGFLPWLALPYVGNTVDIPEEILTEIKNYIDENEKDTTYTALKDGGLKLIGTEFAIDETIKIILDCGGIE